MFLLIGDLYWLGFALLSLTLASPRQPACAAAAAAGADAAGLRLCRSHLARRAVCDVLAARGRDRVRGRRAAIARFGLPAQALALALVRFWRPAAAERVARGADPRRLYRLADRGFRCASARRSSTSRRWSCSLALVQVVYYGVLGATRQHPLQIDHGLRSRRHQPFRQGEPVSRRAGARPKTRCCSNTATSRPSGTSIGGSSPAIS